MSSTDTDAIKRDVAAWLDRLSDGIAPGRFRFALSGSCLPTEGQSGLMATCFAAKIAWQLGVWEKWDSRRKEAVARFIESFQDPSGLFVDPWLKEKSAASLRSWFAVLLRQRSVHEVLGASRRNIAAETRQAFSTLLMVDSMPGRIPPLELRTAEAVKRWMEAQDWSNPWSAGSHMSHHIFMTVLVEKAGNSNVDLDGLLLAFSSSLAQHHDVETGTWFSGKPPVHIKINGAMKVLTALSYMPDSMRVDGRALVDFALAQPVMADGCSFLDRLYVVHEALRSCPLDYRREDVRRLAHEALAATDAFRREDGGFSFYTDRAQTTYYGVRVSNGDMVSDLHGTLMMTWAIALALDLLGESGGWRPHRP